jgi:hypothetical protein
MTTSWWHRHALAAHALVLLDQVLVDARAAVPLMARVERGVHQHLQAAILARVLGAV